jgi:hypothetical protein
LSAFVGTLLFSSGCNRNHSEYEKIQADFISTGGFDGSQRYSIPPVTGVVLTNVQVRTGLYKVVFKDPKNHSRENLWSAFSGTPHAIGSEVEAEQVGIKCNPYDITAFTFLIKEK